MTAPRPASEAPFPYGWQGAVCYFELGDDGVPLQARVRDDLRDMVRRALVDEVRIFAAWPGAYRTDLFVIDEPKRLADAIGLDA